LTSKAGFAPAFLFFRVSEAATKARRIEQAKIFFCRMRNLSRKSAIVYSLADGQTNMRILASMLLFAAIALPCSAQTILKSEPLFLAPYEVAFVQDASCPAGKVLKVTGAIRGLHRKKACVALSAEQASLAVATP
jgi:hypothetical protein